MENLRTFKDLYQTIVAYNIEEFKHLLTIPPRGKDIQESCLRLFAKLNCIEQLEEYDVCSGNFNLSTYKPIRSNYDIFYSNNKLICLKDSGDSSDLTLLSKYDNQVLGFTSKNVKKIQIPKLDIDKISFNNDSKYLLRIGICIPSSKALEKAVKAAKPTTTTKKMLEAISDALVLDHDDLINAYCVFIDKFRDVDFDELMIDALSKIDIRYRPHQIYTIEKSLRYIQKYDALNQYVNILWGHIARSGKSYMMNGLIERLGDIYDVDSNYLIITTAPNETISQYIQIMSVLKTLDFNIITHKNDLTSLSGKNVIILSKQLLTNNSSSDLIIDNVRVIMMDEAHHGGTTDLSKSLLDKYPSCHKIFITATYDKVSYGFSIDKTLKWDLEDIQFMKNKQFSQIEAKYPKFSVAMKEYEDMNEDIPADYSSYPNLSILGLDLTNHLRNYINSDEEMATWSLNTLFEVKAKRLKNTALVEVIFRDILHNIVAKKIEKLNEDSHQRKILNTKSPTVIMCFLPSNNISSLSQLVKTVINRIDDEFEVCICNTTDTSLDIKSNIDQSLVAAGNQKKKAVIALTGTQGHLGVTIENCDLVLLMNNSHSMDFIYQSMFRCMTEADTKKYGYVIDFDIDRSIYNVAEYGKFISTEPITNREAIERVISNGIINLILSDDFHFYDKTKMLENILARYQVSEISNIEHYLKKLVSYDVKLTSEQLANLGSFLIKSSSSKTTVHDDNEENDTEKIKSTSDCSNASSKNGVSREDKQSFMTTLKHLIPIVCMLTLSHPKLIDFNSMIQHIVLNEKMYNILQAQFKIWWKNEMSDEQFLYFTSLFNELGLDKNSEVESIITTIKQLFVESKNDRELLSRNIDTYLIPAIEEKNNNAEVSTPFFLRKEMLDIIPLEFWLVLRKIFEPCCGKGGFVMDIFNRLKATGLYDDRTIIEEMIYFADINPFNVYITTLLLDPEGKYKVNAFVGDTLQMKFDFKFDAVIGNPPYNVDQTSSGNTPIYHKFVEKFIDDCAYLLFVIPSKWFGGSGKGLHAFKNNMLRRTDIQSIQHVDNSKEWFPHSVDIRGGVCYFLKNSNHNGPCIFNGVEYDLSKYDRIIKPNFHSVIDFISLLPSIAEIYQSAGYFKVRTNDTRLRHSGPIECFVSLKKSKSRLMYLENYEFTDHNKFWKVITPEAAGKGSDGFGAVIIGTPSQIYTDSYISFQVESAEHAQYLKTYLKTPFANAMLSLRKMTQHITLEMIRWIPLVPFDREWTDDEVFKHFEFTEEQIEQIHKLY